MEPTAPVKVKRRDLMDNIKSRINAGYNTNNPGLETIGESIGLAATADVIVSIFQDDEDKELGVVKMAMMKNRFGMNHGVTTMKMDYATLTVTEDDSLSNQGDQSSITKTLAMLSNKG